MLRLKMIKTLSTISAMIALLAGCYSVNQTRTVYDVPAATIGGQCIQSCMASRTHCMAHAKKKYSLCLVPTITKTANGYIEQPLYPALWGRTESSCKGMPLDPPCGASIDTTCKSDFDSCMQSCGATVSIYKSRICKARVE